MNAKLPNSLISKTAVCGLLALAAFSGKSYGQMIFAEEGGLWNGYSLDTTQRTWDEARVAATQQSYQGVTGNLAAITSQSEWDHVREYLGTSRGVNPGYFIGLTDAETTSTLDGYNFATQLGSSEGNFKWVTGEQFGTFHPWNAGEPNNSGNEDAVEVSGGGWNDNQAGSSLGAGQYLNNSLVEFRLTPQQIALSSTLKVTTYKSGSTVISNLATADALRAGTDQARVTVSYYQQANMEDSGGAADFPSGPGVIGANNEDNFAVFSTGYLHLKAADAGQYVFRLNADDGQRLRVDLNGDGDFDDPGEQVITNDVLSGPHNVDSVSLTLGTGVYAFEWTWFEDGGGAEGEFSASKDGGAFHLIGDTANGGMFVSQRLTLAPPPGPTRYYLGGNGNFNYTDSNFLTDPNDPGSTTAFAAGDAAVFGNQGSAGARTVTVDANGVTATTILVDNSSANPYTLTGGPLKGDGSFTKDGDGSLTLFGMLSEFIGKFTLRHGTLNVDSIGDATSAGNLGQGDAIDLGDTTGANNAVLNYTGGSTTAVRVLTLASNGGTVNVAQGGSILTLTSLSGSGILTKTGAGELVFNSTTFGDFTGSFAVNTGAVTANALAPGGAGSFITLGSAGSNSGFTYGGKTLADQRALQVGPAGGAVAVTNQNARYQVSSLTSTGALTIGGTGRLAVSGVASFTTLPTIQAGATLALQNESIATPNVIPAGPITLSTGTLVVAPNALGSNTDAITLAGGTLRLAHDGLNIELFQGPVNGPVDMNKFDGTSNNQREYFANNSPAFTGRTNFDGHTDLDISNSSYGTGAPFGSLDADADNIRANFTGKILITTGGDTTFFTTSDDGSGIYIDGQRVVNNNFFQGPVTRQGTINLTPGLHDIQIYFYEGGGGAGVKVEYTPASGARQTVPNSVLYAGDTYTDLRPINLTASSSLETGGTATLGALTQANNTMLTTVGNLNFASTTLVGSAGTYSVSTNALSIVNLGAITATNATINKTGNGSLLFNSAPAGLTLNANGGLIVTQGSEDGAGNTADPLAGTTIHYNGGGIGFSATAGNPIYTENIVTVSDYQVEAGRFANGAPTSVVTWAPANNIITVAAGKTATFTSSTAGYNFNINAPVVADGTVVVNEGNLNFNGDTFRASEGLTVNLAAVAINGPVTTGALKVTGDFAGAQGTSSLYTPGLVAFGTVNASSVTVSGSSLAVGGALTNSGALTVSGGTAHFQNVASNASLTQTGGTITADLALTSTGAATVSGGTLTAGDTFKTGGLTVSGGAVTTTGDLISSAPVSVSAGSVRVGGNLSAPSVATSGTASLTLAGGGAVSGGMTVGAGSTVNLDSGFGQTRMVTGGISIAQGTLHAQSGTTDLGAAALNVTPRTFTPGLLEGVILNTNNGLDLITPNPGTGHTNSDTGGIRLSARMGETNIKDSNNPDGNNHWADNETWVYTGQFHDPDGKFTFAENIDDQTSVKIDGVEVLRNTAYNVVTNTSITDGLNDANTTIAGANIATPNAAGDYGMGPAGDGWHTFEVRFMNGGGGAGTLSAAGWGGGSEFDNKGFGYNADAITGLTGDLYTIAADAGDGQLFRVVGAGGSVSVDAGATIAAGSTTGATIITLNGAVGDGNAATLKLNDMATATSSDADNLKIAGGAGAQGVVDVGAKGTFTVGAIQFADGSSLEKKGVGTLVVSGTINGTAGSSATTFANSSLIVSGGKLLFNGTSNVDAGSSVTAVSFGTVGGTGSIPTLTATNGGTIEPGSNGVGILTVNGDVNMQANTTFSIELNNFLSNDQLVVNGAVNLDSTAALHITLLTGYSITANDLFFLIINDGADPINGTFAGPATVNINGARFKVLYGADFDTSSVNGGNDIALQALNTIPEPGSMVTLFGGLGTLLGLRRFRARGRI